MAKTIRAKFQCYTAQDQGYAERVQLAPVYSAEENSENKSFWDATPNGALDMYITNPGARGLFVVGHEYYLDLTDAAPEEPTPPAD